MMIVIGEICPESSGNAPNLCANVLIILSGKLEVNENTDKH